jgi:hypothetical protein
VDLEGIRPARPTCHSALPVMTKKPSLHVLRTDAKCQTGITIAVSRLILAASWLPCDPDDLIGLGSRSTRSRS